TVPGAVGTLAAVVLERDPSARREIGNRGAGNDKLPVELDLHGFALHRDLEVVPLPDRVVGTRAGRDRRADVGRSLGARANAERLAGPDGPAPDIALVVAIATEKDARVGVGQRQPELLAIDTLGMGSVRQDVRDALVDERRLLEPPVEPQDEVAVLAL